uniref:Uncharacterized protein n=1 Tax=Knipowitschia caucasica TaxID=637954 RepID=A0AAV2MFU2_KNICA
MELIRHEDVVSELRDGTVVGAPDELDGPPVSCRADPPPNGSPEGPHQPLGAAQHGARFRNCVAAEAPGDPSQEP